MERAVLERVVWESGRAESHGDMVFLRDPHWSAAQRRQFQETVEAAQRWKSTAPAANKQGLRPWLGIPTGGSSGGLKFAVHDEGTLGAAVLGFCAHFGVRRVNAVDVLPPWHVSGLMARLRCAATGGMHVAWDWKRLERGEFPVSGPKARVTGCADAGAAWFLSLVPTQLQRLLRVGAAVRWLRGFDGVFVGGGPLWPSLADEASSSELPIILSYGMTETGAMVVAQQRGDFARGDRSSGMPMPHAQVSINGEGLVRVCGASVMRGYLPLSGLDFASHSLEVRREKNSGNLREFTTADLGALDGAGRLHILGRRDEVAISGGEKIRLGEVEAGIRASGSVGVVFEDVAVVAVPDPEWGDRVVACYVRADGLAVSEAEIGAATSGLARHQRPKQWLRVAAEAWPRNAQGKLNRAALREVVLCRRVDPHG